MRWVMVAALAGGAMACEAGTAGGRDMGAPAVSSEGLRDGPAAGAEVIVPDGAYGGSEPITVSEGASIAADAKPPDGTALRAAGPAIHFGPGGTTFRDPVTIKLPFDSTMFAGEDDKKERAIAVVVKEDDEDPVGFHIGPIAVDYVGFHIGPIAIDLGPILIETNEAAGTGQDALVVVDTDGFSTFQVVVIEDQDSANTDAPREEHAPADESIPDEPEEG